MRRSTSMNSIARTTSTPNAATHRNLRNHKQNSSWRRIKRFPSFTLVRNSSQKRCHENEYNSSYIQDDDDNNMYATSEIQYEPPPIDDNMKRLLAMAHPKSHLESSEPIESSYPLPVGYDEDSFSIQSEQPLLLTKHSSTHDEPESKLKIGNNNENQMDHRNDFYHNRNKDEPPPCLQRPHTANRHASLIRKSSIGRLKRVIKKSNSQKSQELSSESLQESELKAAKTNDPQALFPAWRSLRRVVYNSNRNANTNANVIGGPQTKAIANAPSQPMNSLAVDFDPQALYKTPSWASASTLTISLPTLRTEPTQRELPQQHEHSTILASSETATTSSTTLWNFLASALACENGNGQVEQECEPATERDATTVSSSSRSSSKQSFLF